MSRLKKVEVSLHEDVVGRPYVIIQGWGDDSGTDASAIDVRFWAQEIEIKDWRK